MTMKRMAKRVLSATFAGVLLLGFEVVPAGATSCGPLDYIGLGTPVIFKAITGKDPCRSTVIGTGPPLQTIITCTPARLSALPDFKTRGPGTATYQFVGTCMSPERAGAQLTYQIAGQWTPSEQKGHNASETIKMTGYEPLFPDRAPGGQIFLLKYARCTRDPWINPVACVNYGLTVPDDIRSVWTQVDELQSFPWTANVLSPSDKKQLIAQYNQINGIVPGPRTSLQSGVKAVVSTAPIVISPQRDAVIYRTSKFQIVPVQQFSGNRILVQFTQLEGPAGQLKPTFAWVKSTSELVQGADVPLEIFSTAREGHWSMRARIEAPKAGDFSVEVPFRFVMQTPGVMTRPKGQFELQRR
jgi:hypothetical protein